MYHNITKTIIPGSIVLLNRLGKESNFTSSLQRFFTKMPYTHTAIVLEKYMNENVVLSADELTVILPLNNYFEEDKTEIEIYELLLDFDKISITRDLFLNYSGKKYAFLQVLYFIYRWFNETVLKRDVRKEKNIFNKGQICSELVYLYLCEVAQKTNTKELLDKLNEYTKDTIHVGDIANICKSLPQIFALKIKI